MTFFFRYFLQNMRWLLMFVPLFMFSESFFSWKNNNIITSMTPSGFFFKKSFLIFFVNLLQNIIEYVDFLFMNLVQSLAFFTLNFWLFSFIFSVTIKNFFEKN